MKKIISLALMLAMVLSLAACGKARKEKLNIVPDPQAAELSQEGIGHYADIVNEEGAVVGTQYYSTPQEIEMTAQYSDDSIMVQVTLKPIDKVPFSEMSALKIEACKIIDDSGAVSILENTAETANVTDGTAAVKITLPEPDGLKDGSYILKIDSILSEKKGDQPLEIFGNWSIALTK